MNLTPWAWLILPLAVARGHQLLLWDRVFAAPRGWLLAKTNPQGLPMSDPDRSYFSYLLECPWCMSIWVAAVLVLLTLWDVTRTATLAVAAILALSLAAVVLDRMVDRWFPDEPPPTGGDGVHVHGDVVVATSQTPPAAVADVFDKLAGDDTAGPD